MRHLILLLVILFIAPVYGQKIRIQGIAPSYVGKTIEVQRIDDYLSAKKSTITSTTVGTDSSFAVTFYSEAVEKVIVTSENNWGFLYVQPGGNYEIEFPDRNPYDPVMPSGNQVELLFVDLDSNDVNYKILGYQRWLDYFVGSTYHLRNDKKNASFTEQLDTFKMNVQAYYEQDTSKYSYFLKTYVRFSIAGLDNINTIAERNRFEKYDFFLSKYPVSYQNDVYMEYFTSFYEKTIPKLSNEVNEKFYNGILRSSPTVIFNELGAEYTLKNPRIRELAMIQALSEAYYSKDYPKTNIETILDSLSKNSLFEEHEKIAKNILARITDLVPGSKAPNFVITTPYDQVKTLLDFQGKHIYLHFLDPTSKTNLKELEIIKGLNKVYGDYVQIVTIYKDQGKISKDTQKALDELEWNVFGLKPDHSIFNSYQVAKYAHYVLIDAAGYIVSSPAPSPTPDGEYETIDKTFYYLKKAIDQQRNVENQGEYDRNH